MVACSHDMMFTYVYGGWEGTANDSRVFVAAASRPDTGFPFPPLGKPLMQVTNFNVHTVLSSVK